MDENYFRFVSINQLPDSVFFANEISKIFFRKKKNKYLRGIKTKFPLLVSRVHRETASGISRETGGRAKVSGANDTARRRFYPLWTRQAEKRSDGVTFFFFF